MELDEKAIQKIIKWAEQHPEVNEVWFSGSRFRGSAGIDSDVDLGFVFEPTGFGLGNYLGHDADGTKIGKRWQAELTAAIGIDVHISGVMPDTEICGGKRLLWRRG